MLHDSSYVVKYDVRLGQDKCQRLKDCDINNRRNQSDKFRLRNKRYNAGLNCSAQTSWILLHSIVVKFNDKRRIAL